MPITLNHSNISVQYETGSNYIIETVKSDLYFSQARKSYENIINNLQTSPVSVSTYTDNNNIYAVESYIYTGTSITKDYTRVFPQNTVCDILIVGGGGAGGYSYVGGGGGAGGYIFIQNITLNGSYTIKVGKGGENTTSNGNNGENSSIVGTNANYTALGGGGGAGGSSGGAISGVGNNGGSGGGGSYKGVQPQTFAAGGISTQLSTNGYGNGGNGFDFVSPWVVGGGGGGASGNAISANGANGLSNSITGVSITYAGGGGGGADGNTPSNGGTGGGGSGATGDGVSLAIAGTDGLGGGGGGGRGSGVSSGGKGGSGIVIIRYLAGSISTNLTAEPTISPTVTSNLAIFNHSGGTENQTPHTIYFPINTVCDILVVGGGGGGSQGGGGGGGYVYNTNVILNGRYSIIVGKGGSGSLYGVDGQQGSNSSFIGGNINYIAYGGGGGGGDARMAPAHTTGQVGSYGGNGLDFTTAQTYTSTQGNRGGSSSFGSYGSGGGGGGAGQVGGNPVNITSSPTLFRERGGNGGNGLSNSITGTAIFYAGGGAGGTNTNSSSTPSTSGTPTGGSGGGGNGNLQQSGNGTSGTNGLGGGGGGGDDTRTVGASGGSGVVIIRVISPTIFKYLFFNYSPTQPTLDYTLNFPTRTMVNFINSGDELMNGQYTVSVRTTQSTITPTQGQNLQDRLYFTSNFAIRYHLLNPELDPIGAQWTYNSSNANVYHMGSVGIGTTSPEYSLDVRGTIFSSTGGYTQTGLTTWSITSDRRIKDNIIKASYEKCLENVKNIELYNFNFKDNCVNTNDRRQLGFIAQEVQQVYPKAVEVGKMILNLEEKIDDLLTLNTTQIDYTLYGAVKGLIHKMENIKIKMEQIKGTSNITMQA